MSTTMVTIGTAVFQITVALFDSASQFVREEDVAGSIPCGDDVDAVITAAKAYADAGFTHLALVQIGGDQQRPFLEWSRTTLAPAWRVAFGD